MKFVGGYNIALEGKPSLDVREIPKPDALHLPLFSRRFDFSKLAVAEGDNVEEGRILATDPDNYSVPLLASRAGVVNLDAVPRHITLEKIRPGADKAADAAGSKTEKLLQLGAWQFFSDALTGDLPDPAGKPQAVIVSSFGMDSFVPATEALLRDRLSDFERGLELVHALAATQQIILVSPCGESEPAVQLRDMADRNSWIRLFETPIKYPFGNLKLNAQRLDMTADNGPIWGLGVQGVLAVDRALTASKPCVSRVISIGGPAVRDPSHANICAGYPIKAICDAYLMEQDDEEDDKPVRLINGGALAGRAIAADQLGLDAECLSLTMIFENTERETLAFAHVGLNKHAFTNTFFSAMMPFFRERYTTALRGELRPCVACSCCEQVCPAGIMPFLVHRYVDKNRLEEAQRFGLSLCVECGLCSHVCLAKREISQALFEGHEAVRREAEERENQT